MQKLFFHLFFFIYQNAKIKKNLYFIATQGWTLLSTNAKLRWCWWRLWKLSFRRASMNHDDVLKFLKVCDRHHVWPDALNFPNEIRSIDKLTRWRRHQIELGRRLNSSLWDHLFKQKFVRRRLGWLPTFSSSSSLSWELNFSNFKRPSMVRKVCGLNL